MSPKAQWEEQLQREQWVTANQSPLSQLGRIDHSRQPQQDSLGVGGVTG